MNKLRHIISAGILIQSKDKYLLGHSTALYDIDNGRRWGVPKGEVDPGESPYDTVLREVEEETGLNLQHLGILPERTPIMTLSFTVKDRYTKDIIVYHVIDEEGVLQHEHLVCKSYITGTNVPELDDFRWVTKTQARAIIAKSQEPLISKL
jgi:8-oxo-dGTP pyrophosphatase MutT (NUDIX family)